MQLPNTFLSLRQMSLCNIALQVYNDPNVSNFRNTHDINSCIWSSDEIESLLGEELATLLNYEQVLQMFSMRRKPTLSHEYQHQFTGDYNHHSTSNQLLEFYVEKKLSTLLLPEMFKKEVTDLVRLAFIESYKWLQDHKTIINSKKSLLRSTRNFHWTQDNKIDRHKTAKAIIADHDINIRDRFKLASHYCFQEDVFLIWEILDDAQRNYFEGLDLNIVQIWVNWTRHGGDINWEEIARNSHFGLQPYFPKLKREERLQKLMSLRCGIWNDYHELQFCLSILDQNEQDEILKKCPFPILEVFLDWSVQGKLLDVVELLWPYLSEQNCCDFLYLILYQKRMLNGIGYDYVTLVKKLWKRVFGYKKVIESDTMYNTLSLVLEYGRSRPCPHELREHNNDNMFVALHKGSSVFVICKYKRNFSSFMSSLCQIIHRYGRIRMMCFIQG
ncbi:uncharacterized protein TNIN_275021 [Trichonephila inaurata madagascariensis]|uniref:Uncharacterized protein n=1 Tax=Trichonephila inaurata madagascariensis TaxID=2747483 RepID=A0A8X6YQD0_9ARAC|nr:uncharacterized protein TNIN_275021 [Trichonephila inaurata madagascariensis]